MIRLIVADAVFNGRVWVGAFVVAVAATTAGSIPATLFRTAAESGGRPGLGLAAIAGTVIAFTAVAVVVVVDGIMAATVALQSRSYALWQILGVSPRSVREVVGAQLAIVTAAGALVGAGVGLAAPTFVRSQLRQASGLAGADPTVRISDMAVVGVVVVALSLLAGVRAAAEAAATPAVSVLRDAERTRRVRATPRILVGVALVALAAQMTISLPAALPDGAPAAVLIGPVLVAAFAAVAPFVAPPMLALWTNAMPARASASFAVARALVLHASTRSVTTVTALVVAIGLPVTLDSGRRTVATALGSEPATGAGAIALVLGGPVLLAAVGAAAAAYMSSRTRDRDQALLRAAGATSAFTLAVALLEAIVQVVNAAIAVVVISLLSGVAETVALSAVTARVNLVVPLGTLSLAIAATAPLMIAATLVPAVLGERHGLRERLAVADS